MNGLAVIARELAADANVVVLRQDRPTSQILWQATAADFEAFGSLAGLQPFTVGSLGNFPYYWQDPNNLEFNAKTYAWIAASLKANTSPVQLDQPFTNLYIEALSTISYSLSTIDQTELNQAKQNATDQQGAVLRAWQNAFGSIPLGTQSQEPIDIIMNKITQVWASPPTTLEQLQTAIDLKSILNKTPASGESVLPALSNYLNALDSSISLLNATTMNTAYLQRALDAVQRPTSDNSALKTSDGIMVPAYAVATPLQHILDGLNSTDSAKAFAFKMSVVRSSSTEYAVTTKGHRAVNVPAADFLSVLTDRNADLFQDKIATGSHPTGVDVAFTGVTMVYYSLVVFSMASLKNWYWITPITNAIKNGSQNISGFKFSPDPQIDFTKLGPFGFLNGVAISKNASLTLTSKGANYKTIAQAVQATPSANLKFLGMPLGPIGTSSEYTASVVTNDADSSVQVNFKPSMAGVGDSMDSTAFVLGVQTNFPEA
ncbi:MAG: lamin tail domain-containing protein [Candidatus Binatia bacterium]